MDHKHSCGTARFLALAGIWAWTMAACAADAPATAHSWDFVSLGSDQQQWRLLRNKEPEASGDTWEALQAWDFGALPQDAWEWRFPERETVQASPQGASFETRACEAEIILVRKDAIVTAEHVDVVQCVVQVTRPSGENKDAVVVSMPSAPVMDWDILEHVQAAPDRVFNPGSTNNSWQLGASASGDETYLWKPRSHSGWKGKLAAFRIHVFMPRALTPTEAPYRVTFRRIQFARHSDLTCTKPPTTTNEGLSFATRGPSWSLSLNGQSLRAADFDTLRITFAVQRRNDSGTPPEEVRLSSSPVLYWALQDPSRKDGWPFDKERVVPLVSKEIVSPRNWDARVPLDQRDTVSDLLVSVPMPSALASNEPPYQVSVQRIDLLRVGGATSERRSWLWVGGTGVVLVCHALLWWRRRSSSAVKGDSPDGSSGGRLCKELLVFAVVCLAAKGGILLLDAYPIIHGDSLSYVAVSQAVTETPAARPPGYSLLIWIFRTVSGSSTLATIVIGQTLIGVGTSILALYFLRSVLGLPRKGAWPLALLVALSPMNLALERAILSETSVLLLFAALLVGAYSLFRRPRTLGVVAVAILAASLQEFRHVYVFVPLVLGLLLLLRACFCQRGERMLWAVSAALLYLIASLTSDAADRVFMSKRAPDYAMTERNFDSGSGLSFGYWCTWCRWSCVAESHDLDQYDWGPILLADIPDLRQGVQWFRPESATNRFLRTCRMTETQRQQVFKTACIEMMKRHPIRVTALIAKGMWEWFTGEEAAPPTTRTALDPLSVKTIEDTIPEGKELLNEARNGWSFSPVLEAPCIGYGRGRGVFLAAVAAMWVCAALNLRMRFPAFALASLMLVYFLSINVSGVLIERYYQPVEFAGVFAVGYLWAEWRHTRRNRGSDVVLPAP